MAKQKEKEKKEETQVMETEPFNLDSALQALEESGMLKAGFTLYIKNNNLTIKSENDLKNKFQKFKQMNAGA